MQKTTLLPLTIFLISLIAVSGAASAAEISVGSLPDDIVPGNTYTVPVTITGTGGAADTEIYLFGIKYDENATTVEIENYGDAIPGYPAGGMSLIRVGDAVASATFDVRITPMASDNITIKISVNQDDLSTPDYTATLTTNVRAAQTPPKGTQSGQTPSKGTQSGQSPSKAAESGQDTVVPVTSLTLTTVSPSPEAADKAPSDDEKMPAIGLFGIFAGLGAAGILVRRKN